MDQCIRQKYMYSILLAERPSDKRTVWAEKDVMLLQDHTFHEKEVRNGKSEVRKVTYKNGVLSKIDLASRFPKGPQKNAKFAKDRRKMSYLRFFRSLAVFSFDLHQCVKYMSLSSTGQMDNDCFFETKNDALSMV